MRNDLNTITNVYEYLGELVEDAQGKIAIAIGEKREDHQQFWNGVKAGLELALEKIDIMRQVEENR